MLSYII